MRQLDIKMNATKTNKKKKSILFFLVHPSKFYVFRNTINLLIDRGHYVKVLITTKDVLEELVKTEKWNYFNIFPEGRKIKFLPKMLSALINSIRTIIRLNKFSKERDYDLFITDDFLVINGKLNGVPSIKFHVDDISVVPESSIQLFFADHILAPSVTNIGRFKNKLIPFYGYKELGGYHISTFIPNRSVIEDFHKSNKPYYIIRLVSLTATHDNEASGLKENDILKLITLLEKHGAVYISSEKKLSNKFRRYLLNINAADMPHILYHANLFISDSQTMSAEAGVLGTPFVRYSDFVGRISYLDELENRYGLGFGVKTNDKEKLFAVVMNLLNTPNIKTNWNNKRMKMLTEKVDLTAMLLWLIENFPQSIDRLKNNPDYQNRFIINQSQFQYLFEMDKSGLR